MAFGRNGFILELTLTQLQALLGDAIPEGGYVSEVIAEQHGQRLSIKINGCGPARLEGELYQRRGYDCPQPVM